MGARIDWDESKHALTVRAGGRLQGRKIDVNDMIDAVPILSVIGCYAEGTTEICNAQIARNKESDRLHPIATELTKMGARIEEKEDGLVIAHAPLQGSAVESNRDHRIAMSLAVAALGAKGDTLVNGAECVAKTYPSFARDFKQCGAEIEEL